MHIKTPSLSPLINLFLISISLLAEKSLGIADPKFLSCSVFKRCGGLDIHYPFYIQNQQPDFCGFPGFMVSCINNRTLIKLSETEYFIQNISYLNDSLTVSNAAILNYNSSSTSCVPKLQNLTYLPPNQLSFGTKVTNLSLFYNCNSSKLSQDVLPYKINCSSQQSKQEEESSKGSVLAIHNKDVDPKIITNASSWGCDSMVDTPVELEGDYHNNGSDGIMNILRNGFELIWGAANCTYCSESGGRCGFDYEIYQFKCYCPERPHALSCPKSSKSGLQKALIVGGAVTGGLVLTIILVLLAIKQQFISKRYLGNQDIEDFIRQYGSLSPKRYNYSEIKRMTNSFKDKLGQGGYGAVYKGMLQDGQFVAVKILNTSKGNGQEFINEVASISRTSHVNIVTLLGFCFEGKRRALIYEFMANGSLNKFINDGTNPTLLHVPLGWEELYQIAIGIARGLEYLHCGCNTKILHFDIKPHNILLDEQFHPKISDFGLAKLCLKKESIVSMMVARGTIGYIAPEVFNRNFGEVSSKSDVYSYGMMVLEMIGVTRNTDVDVNSSSQYFPDWICERLELSQDLDLNGNLTLEESKILRKMTLVGLWCIQMRPSKRPSISKVIEMLEGSIEALQIPPRPFFSSSPRVIEGSHSTSTLLMEE